MKFVEMTDGIPGRRTKKALKPYIEEFMNMNVKVARVDFNEHDYKDANIARTCFYRHIETHGYPVKVVKRDNEIYFVRKDI